MNRDNALRHLFELFNRASRGRQPDLMVPEWMRREIQRRRQGHRKTWRSPWPGRYFWR